MIRTKWDSIENENRKKKEASDQRMTNTEKYNRSLKSMERMVIQNSVTAKAIKD